MGERVQGGRLAARAIAAAGIDTIFTLSGGHVMPIYEGCRHEGVRVVDVRHEQSAAHAAEAWGRVRRTAGVALVTAGPGVTGTVTAVANCLAAQTPLVVLGGARPLAQAEWGALQEFDQLSLMKPVTKWAAVCPATDRIPEYVAIAFRHALAPPRGPVYLELPADILFADGDAEPITFRRTGARLRRPGRDRGGGRPASLGRAARARRGERRLVGRRCLGTRAARGDGAAAGVPERLGARVAAARPRALLPALPERSARGGRRRLRGRHPARLPPPLRPVRCRDADPHPRRPARARPEPGSRRRHRRRLRRGARRARGRRLAPGGRARRMARAAPRGRGRRGGTAIARRSSRTRRRSTTTGSARSSIACSIRTPW